jgi:pseudouridine-5'-monophosphatase
VASDENRSPLAAVLFDLDGVLLDSEPLYTEATQAVVGRFGKVFDWSVKGEIIGRSSLEGARYTIDALSLPLSPEEYLAERGAHLDRLFTNVPLMPGAKELVQELLDRGIPIAVATSSTRRLFLQKTLPHPFFGRFDAVVCGDDPRVKALKPAPDIFLVAAAELSVSPERCLVIEDSLAGVSAAKKAGARVIAVPDPNVDAKRYHEAERVLSSLMEIDLTELGLTGRRAR